MNNRVLFLIIGREVKYLANSTMDHREWYLSLGLDPNLFDTVVRGFIMDNKIVFYKGTFNYDEEVIKAAKMFTPSIRYSMNNPSLEVYCGVLVNAGEKWEPILRINENEITGFVEDKREEKKEVVPIETGPVLEFKNDPNDPVFIRRAIIVSSVVLILTLIIKILLFREGKYLQLQNGMDVFLAAGQVILLGLTIYGYWKRLSFAKYLGLVSSILIFLTLNIWDILIGILYFLFNIDQNYFVKGLDSVKKIVKKDKNGKSS